MQKICETVSSKNSVIATSVILQKSSKKYGKYNTNVQLINANIGEAIGSDCRKRGE